ncbi:MAG: HEAT repeat domain-containing protein [Verrucomicrobiae bacterium]|nr:HEAT repeat domain-containing protein [Verrucomicrobiae bacterium]
MKMLSLCLLLVIVISALRAAESEAERQAIAVLQSSASVAQKEAACLRLKEIGTASSVPVLANLLADDALAQWALDALETLPAPDASDALLAALPAASGKTKAGVIHSLGIRRESRAVPELAKLVRAVDGMVAVAAAQALGRIGSLDALAAIQTGRSGLGEGRIRVHFSDALLACVDRLRAGGKVEVAAKVYEELRSPEESPAVRMAAFRGSVLCADDQLTSRVVRALTGPDELEQAVAIQLVRELPDSSATRTFAEALEQVAPVVQVALIEALRQRGDPAAATVLAHATRRGEAAARTAAIRALGELGDENHVALLAELAAGGAGEERSAARAALARLRRDNILAAILSQIESASAAVKVELVQALARRGDGRAVPDLLRLAGRDDPQVGLAATQALERLANATELEPLLALILQADGEARREAAVETFVAVGLRSPTPHTFSRAALNALNRAPTGARIALLEAAGQIGGPGVIEALRAALGDAGSDVRQAALRTLAEHGGDAARDDLLKYARQTPSDADRTIALRGYWRLVEAMDQHSHADRFAAVRAGLDATKTPAERKLGLARLAELRGPEALELARAYRSDSDVRAEAETACLQIASQLDSARMDVAIAILRDLAQTAGTDRVREEARKVLSALERLSGFVCAWLVSGPYRQAGKEAQQLFDVAFAPESTPSQAGWRPLPGGGNLTNSWLADLGTVVGGDHCVVYLQSRVFCPVAQPVALEIGSDDGVKLWINGALVHANNAVRGFTAGEDKAQAVLKEGWNEFLVKITQHTLGCAVAIRVLDPDGKPIPGLRVEAGD